MTPARAAAPDEAQVAVLAAAVQANCHIADARHATDLSLCNYLLQMREFYRWERGLPFGAVLPRAELGAWLAERERLWAEVEGDDFTPLPPAGSDAFDRAAVAPHADALGLAYGAGLAGRERPGFFLAEHVRTQVLDDGGHRLTLQVCGRELARGLFAPPAALIGDTIVLRRESLARWLWELTEAHGLKRAEGPFAEVARAYGLIDDFDAGLPRALDEIGELLLLHELGEHRIGRRLGPAWGELRLCTTDRRSALALAALRDLLVDLEFTLPELLARDARTALHFWFATFEGLRAQMAPGLKAAYVAWRAGDGGHALQQACARGRDHFQALAQRVLAAPDGPALAALRAAAADGGGPRRD